MKISVSIKLYIAMILLSWVFCVNLVGLKNNICIQLYIIQFVNVISVIHHISIDLYSSSDSMNQNIQKFDSFDRIILRCHYHIDDCMSNVMSNFLSCLCIQLHCMKSYHVKWYPDAWLFWSHEKQWLHWKYAVNYVLKQQNLSLYRIA